MGHTTVQHGAACDKRNYSI